MSRLFIGFDVGEMNPTQRVLGKKELTFDEVSQLLAAEKWTSRCAPRFKEHVDTLARKGLSLSIDESARISYLKKGDRYLLIIPPAPSETDYRFELYSASR